MIHKFPLGAAIAISLCASTTLADPAQPMAKPEVFAPGVISGPANDDAPVFTPDGRTVFFFRSNQEDYDIMVSHLVGTRWAAPRIAPFSGQWRDLEPAMAPDGSYMIFASSRPIHGGYVRLDGHWGDKMHPGRGGNLWRVDRKGKGWSTPTRLPDTINQADSTFSPGIARDGTLYFMAASGEGGHFRIYRAPLENGRYQPPQLLPFCVSYGCADGTIAPDQSFIVFSSNRPPAAAQSMALFIAFRDGTHWSEPVALGPEITGSESRLGPDGHTLYFSSGHVVPPAFPKTGATSASGLRDMQSWNNGADNIWKIDLAPWIARHARDVMAARSESADSK